MNNDKNVELPQIQKRSDALPNNAIERVEKGVPASIMDIQDKLLEMGKLGRVQDADEMLERYNQARDIFKSQDMRLGIESICLCLGITRQTLWNWERGIGCDNDMQMVAKMIKQANASYLETLTLSGKVSPPVGIFALKNMANWSDTPAIQTSETPQKMLTVKDLQILQFEKGKESAETEEKKLNNWLDDDNKTDFV